MISRWTLVEFSAALANAARTYKVPRQVVQAAEAQLDDVVRSSFKIVGPQSTDFDYARALVQRGAANLRAPDALHLAIAANRNAQAIYTLDVGMLKAGKLLGLPVARGI